MMCCGVPGSDHFHDFQDPDILKRNIEPYLKTMERIQANPQIQEAFGQPIRDDSWMPGGNVRDSIILGFGRPKGKGKVFIKTRLQMANGRSY